MPYKRDFYPPLMNPALVRLCQWIVPFYARVKNRVTLQVDSTSLKVLNDLAGDRVLLMPNHPTYYDDWIAIFVLSAKLRKAYHYLAAHERFRGLEGKLIQRLGAYSIRRGLGDRPSVTMTRELMMQPGCHLVIFPEGGCSYQNDTVMPFRFGAIQIAFQSLGKLQRQQQQMPNLYAVPISIKYRYTQNMEPIIHQTLRGLETKLALAPDPTATHYQRLRVIAEHLMASFEKTYTLPPLEPTSLTLNDRIHRLRTHLVSSCESRLSILSRPDQPVRERVYKIQSVLEEKAEILAVEDFWSYDLMHQVAINLLNFDAIYDGYVAASPTPERFLDTLIRLERYVFNIDYPPPKAHRQVLLQVGEPVNLRHYYEQYVGDRTQTVHLVTQILQDSVQTNLDRLAQYAVPTAR